MAESFDFNAIVAEAASRFRQRTGVFVDAEARNVLLSRALEHKTDVDRAVAEQGLTIADLVDAAEQQLREAIPFINEPRLDESPQQQQQQQRQQQQKQQQEYQQQQQQQQQQAEMSARAVHEGMRTKCWFVPWC